MLPTDAKVRKKYPIATGVIDYFPDALAEVSKVSAIGNVQHNGPDAPLHWDRSKSQDEADALIRHFIDRGKTDNDGVLHSAKTAWRSLALLQKEIESNRDKPRKDYTGLVIGNRIVLSFSHFTKNHHDPMWNVHCNSCGHEFKSLTQDLKRTSCRNCTMRHRRKRPFESLYNTFVKKASKRHPVKLSYEEFVSFTNISECHYCGEPIDWLKFQTRRKDKPYRGQAYNLDRKDSNEIYEFKNLVVCCPRCNLSKNNHFTYEEWKQLGDMIRSWRSREQK